MRAARTLVVAVAVIAVGSAWAGAAVTGHGGAGRRSPRCHRAGHRHHRRCRVQASAHRARKLKRLSLASAPFHFSGKLGARDANSDDSPIRRGPYHAHRLDFPFVMLPTGLRGAAVYRPSRRPAAHAADALGIYRATEVLDHIDTQPSNADQAFEPTEADDGRYVMYAANFFGAFSSDRGTTFKLVQPMNIFPNTDGGYCCDQIVRYASQIDRFIWLIQYGVKKATNQNHYILAIARPADLAADPVHAWTAWEIDDGTFGLSGQSFDFPDMQVGAGDLYISANVGYDGSHGAVVLRYTLSSLAAGTPSGWFWPVEGRFARIAQGSGQRAYWVSLRNPTTLVGYYADESSSTAWHRDVSIQSQTTQNYCLQAYNGQAVVPGFDKNCPDTGPGDQGVIIHSIGSGLVSATVNDDRLWVAWTGGRDDPSGSRIYPYAMVGLATIQFPDITLSGQSAFWSDQEAIVHPSLATNGDGEVGFVVSAGNGRDPANSTPSNLSLPVDAYAGILDQQSMLPSSWIDIVHESDSITGGADYQSISPAYPNTSCFAVATYVRNANAPGTPSVDHPWSVLFSRAGNACQGPLVPPPDQRAASDVSLNCGGGGRVGVPVTIYGQFHSQPTAGAQIQLTYQAPDRTVYGPHNITTDQTGLFDDTIVPAIGKDGMWTVTADFPGDDYRLPTSTTCQLGVAPSSGPPLPTQPSHTTLSCPSIASDQFSIGVSGSVTPAIAGGSVAVKYAAPSGGVTTHNVTTDSNGDYTDALQLTGGSSDGNWTIQAHFAGGGGLQPSDSPACTTYVQGPR